MQQRPIQCKIFSCKGRPQCRKGGRGGARTGALATARLPGPEEDRALQSTLELEEDEALVAVIAEKHKRPSDLTEQVTTLRELLKGAGAGVLPIETIASAFKHKLSSKRQSEAAKLLEMMASLGQAELVEGGWRG